MLLAEYAIPYGFVRTHGSITRILGNLQVARAAGMPSHTIPFPSLYPATGDFGRTASWEDSRAKRKMKKALLEKERVRFATDGRVFLNAYGTDPAVRLMN